MAGSGSPRSASSRLTEISRTTTLTNGSSDQDLSFHVNGDTQRTHATATQTPVNGVASHHVPPGASTSLGARDPFRERPRRQALTRANTDHGPRRPSPSERSASTSEWTQDNEELRHGWEDQYQSSEYLNVLNSVSGQAASPHQSSTN